MMKCFVLLCLVGVIAAAEVDFRRRSNVPAGRPIHVPVVSQRNINQQKRQVDFPLPGSRSSNGPTSRQQTGVPLQRPPVQHSSSFRRPQQEQSGEPITHSQRGAPSSNFSPPPPSSEQIFPPLRDQSEENGRQQPRPVRPAARPSLSSIERPNKNPEFAGGFPAGFTNGLPAFDFQGRMPEPDTKSDGFMDGVLNNFPNLKSFGGFDAFPDVAREDVNEAQVKRPVRPASRPNNAQLSGFRPQAN